MFFQLFLISVTVTVNWKNTAVLYWPLEWQGGGWQWTNHRSCDYDDDGDDDDDDKLTTKSRHLQPVKTHRHTYTHTHRHTYSHAHCYTHLPA